MVINSSNVISEPEICLARYTLRYRGREVRLPELSFRLLCLLSERAPEPVAFDEIERLVWGAYVSRETIKQRVKILRDCLSELGVADGGIQSARNVGYRLTQTLGTYEPEVSGKPSSGRRIGFVAGGLAIGLGAVALYLSQADARSTSAPLSLSVRSDASLAGPGSRSPAWDAAQQMLIRDLSRMSNLVVVAADRKRPTDLIVEMDRIPDGPFETMALELVETDSGTVLWSEIYGLDQAGYGKPISHFVANVHEQVVALGLRPEARDLFSNRSNRVRQLYMSASALAKSGKEADLLAARSRLDSALEMRPTFALGRSLRARVDAKLVMGHGRDQRVAMRALTEAQSLVDENPDVPEFRRTLATVQIATGALTEALENLEIAERNMPFLRRDVAALRRRIDPQQNP